MEITLSYLALALSAATLLVTIYLAIRLKTVHYLLQQPVVKKMSPQLRLKPVKLDEALDRNRNRGQGDRPSGREGGRPERRDGREGREGRPESERREARPERREGDRSRDGRPERRDGRPEGERREGRPERREGREGDRNRDVRPERREGRPEGERREGRDDRRPPREFSENREAPSPSQPEYSAPAAESGSGLPPRRPLPSFSDSPVERTETQAPVRESAADTFVGSGDDVQHGRRTQLKKKPRFDFDEAETPPAV
jgi:ribonuclease E